MSKVYTYECSSCGYQFETEDRHLDYYRPCEECDVQNSHYRFIKKTKVEEPDILDEVSEVVNDRENVHGSVYETHSAIADLFEVFVRYKYGVEIDPTAADAADLLDMCLKDARKLTGETDKDTYRDAIGYNYCAWKCHEEDS